MLPSGPIRDVIASETVSCTHVIGDPALILPKTSLLSGNKDDHDLMGLSLWCVVLLSHRPGSPSPPAPGLPNTAASCVRNSALGVLRPKEGA